jgi:hypothetical protein
LEGNLFACGLWKISPFYFEDNPRILWRFKMVGDRIEAIPIDERHVIWLDPKVP